ncbi:oligosaccharide flippase family protein [Klebsiella pneumoniae]|nr:oligosaccharide flippase family protein [Klebsiella pneumoniae]MCP6065259.1 oligosaccharide flippase family protein [Klebsiella pneumoniae]MCP6209458.1 oligosaccharide flippase family protein [Klebsiella pneumoniae]HCM6242998.1 oligosaccharide flippase family protein [Klebsiella pneumoniae]
MSKLSMVKELNKYTRLLNNSMIFALGGFGSKFILILLVPFYTFILSSSDYGVVDLMTSTLSFLLPFVTLTIEQALLRFVIKKKERDTIEKYFSNSFFICFFMLFLFFIVTFFLYLFDFYERKLIIYFYLMIFFSVTQVIYSTYLRAIGKSKAFAISGVFQVFVLCLSNVIFLLIFKMGVDGYLLSLILSSGVTTILCYFLSDKTFFSIKNFDKKVAIQMLLFSLPLIPNFSMWWLVNNSTRYVVLLYIGLTANGLFAVASKVPTIINMFVTVFQQAWQISAFEEFESKDKSVYYSTIFRMYYQFLFLIGSIILLLTKYVFSYFLADEYYSAWVAVPFLVLSILYQTFSAFLGTIYTAYFKTKNIFLTSCIGATLAITFNFLLVPHWGLMAAGLGASLGFIVMMILRLIDTRRMVNMSINYIEFCLLNFIYIVQAIILINYQDISSSNMLFIQLLFVLVFLFISREFLKITHNFVLRLIFKSHN